MILDAKLGVRGVLVNAETGQRIPFAFWADTETGVYYAHRATPDGKAIAQPRQTYRGVAKLSFIKGESLPLPKAGASPVPEELRRKAKLLAKTGVRLECEEPGCHRRAHWMTGDEQVIEPAVGEDGWHYERSVVVKGHYYCDEHYRLPVSTSERGVESEVQVSARPEWKSL